MAGAEVPEPLIPRKQRDPKRSGGVMEWWSIGVFNTPTLHYPITPGRWFSNGIRMSGSGPLSAFLPRRLPDSGYFPRFSSALNASRWTRGSLSLLATYRSHCSTWGSEAKSFRAPAAFSRTTGSESCRP